MAWECLLPSSAWRGSEWGKFVLTIININRQAELEGRHSQAGAWEREIGCADDRRRIVRVNNSNDALRTSAHPIISASYRVIISASYRVGLGMSIAKLRLAWQ